jgi:hypothetical protein
MTATGGSNKMIIITAAQAPREFLPTIIKENQIVYGISVCVTVKLIMHAR